MDTKTSKETQVTPTTRRQRKVTEQRAARGQKTIKVTLHEDIIRLLDEFCMLCGHRRLKNNRERGIARSSVISYWIKGAISGSHYPIPETRLANAAYMAYQIARYRHHELGDDLAMVAQILTDADQPLPEPSLWDKWTAEDVERLLDRHHFDSIMLDAEFEPEDSVDDVATDANKADKKNSSNKPFLSTFKNNSRKSKSSKFKKSGKRNPNKSSADLKDKNNNPTKYTNHPLSSGDWDDDFIEDSDEDFDDEWDDDPKAVSNGLGRSEVPSYRVKTSEQCVSSSSAKRGKKIKSAVKSSKISKGVRPAANTNKKHGRNRQASSTQENGIHKRPHPKSPDFQKWFDTHYPVEDNSTELSDDISHSDYYEDLSHNEDSSDNIQTTNLSQIVRQGRYEINGITSIDKFDQESDSNYEGWGADYDD